MKDSKYYKRLMKKDNLNNKVWLTKLLISIIIVLLILIGSNLSDKFNSFMINNVLSNNLNFSKVYRIYDKYIGSYKKDNVTLVSSEISDLSTYQKENNDGIYSIDVGKEYVVSFLSSGIIVYNAEKDDLGPTVIVQGNDGVDIWYSNVILNEYSLYDYVSKGDILGNVLDDTLIISIVKDGEKLDYEEYFA